MRRLVFLVSMVLSASFAQADELFPSYGDLVEFVDNQVMKRDIVPLIVRLGGRDEYTDEELEVLNAQFLGTIAFDFTNVDIVISRDLSDTFTQEIRAYWNDKNNYVFIYFLLHKRTGGIIVQNFSFNTSAAEVLKLM